jgi:Flp pilus assembly protein TadB
MRWIREGQQQQQQGTPQAQLRAQQQQERCQQRQQQLQQQEQQLQQGAVSFAGMAMVPALHTILSTVSAVLIVALW